MEGPASRGPLRVPLKTQQQQTEIEFSHWLQIMNHLSMSRHRAALIQLPLLFCTSAADALTVKLRRLPVRLLLLGSSLRRAIILTTFPQMFHICNILQKQPRASTHRGQINLDSAPHCATTNTAPLAHTFSGCAYNYSHVSSSVVRNNERQRR